MRPYRRAHPPTCSLTALTLTHAFSARPHSLATWHSLVLLNAPSRAQALRFGEKCAKVSNDADINQAAMSDMLAAIDKEMDALEKAKQTNRLI